MGMLVLYTATRGRGALASIILRAPTVLCMRSSHLCAATGRRTELKMVVNPRFFVTAGPRPSALSPTTGAPGRLSSWVWAAIRVGYTCCGAARFTPVQVCLWPPTPDPPPPRTRKRWKCVFPPPPHAGGGGRGTRIDGNSRGILTKRARKIPHGAGERPESYHTPHPPSGPPMCGD